MKAIVRLIFLSILICTACSPVSPSPPPTPFPSPERSNTPPSTRTPTIAPSPSQNQAAFRQETAVAALTQVAKRLATVTARSILATTNAPTPNEEATYAAWYEGVKGQVLETTPKIIKTYPSPDGQFLVELIRYECVQLAGGVDQGAYEQLNLVRHIDGSEQLLADQLQSCVGIGAYGLGGLFWSSNGRYFYYTTSRYGVPDGDFCELWVRSMYRFDVNTDQVECTPGIGELTADGKTMIIPGQGEFILWDLDKGESRRIPFTLKNSILVAYQLSPDKKSLAYIEKKDCSYLPGKSYLVLLDLQTLQQTQLVAADDPPLWGLNWKDPGKITLSKLDSSRWLFDLATSALTQSK
jgi:hypothetical protein